MGKKYLIDTNALIDAQMKRFPEKGLEWMAKVIDADFTVSFITYIEFLGYKNALPSSRDFIELARVIEINKSAIDICVELRKKHFIKLPDAIIAATALLHNLTLITCNNNDFKNIDGLEIIDPHSIK